MSKSVQEEGCKKLAYVLRKARKDMNLTMEEASKRIKISRQNLHLIEKGERPNVSFVVIVRMADVYGVSLDYLSQYVKHAF